MGFLGRSEGKESAYNVGDLGSIPRSGRSPGEGNGNPLQYSCLQNPIDGGAWKATDHGVTNSWTRLSDFTFFNLHRYMCESEVAQLCSTFRNPMDCSLPGSSIHGIFQARVLEWSAISFSRRSS